MVVPKKTLIQRDLSMLPHETENAVDIQNKYAAEFKTCSDHLEIVHESVLPELCEAIKRCPYATCLAGVGILVRDIRRFRSAALECQFGYVENAEILTRSMFESLLAGRFIFGPDKPTKDCSPKLREALKCLAEIPNGLTQRDFRALLYCHRTTFGVRYMGIRARRHANLRKSAKDKGSRLEECLPEIEKQIGKEWVNKLKSWSNYSGMSISNLAENAGLSELYDTFYAMNSLTSHASDPLRHLEFDESSGAVGLGIAGFDDGDMRRVLYCANGLLNQVCMDFGEVFDLPSLSKLQSILPRIMVIDPHSKQSA